MDTATFELYSKRLNELPALLSIVDKPDAGRELLKWYVRCAEAPQLRGDAAWGISSLRQRKRAELTQSQADELAEILTKENPPAENSAKLVAQISNFPNEKIDRYLLESLRRSHELGWSKITRLAIEQLPGRLNIKISESTVARLDEYWDLLGEVDDDSDKTTVAEQLEKSGNRDKPEDAKMRLAVFWGSLTSEFYLQCKDGLVNPDVRSSK